MAELKLDKLMTRQTEAITSLSLPGSCGTPSPGHCPCSSISRLCSSSPQTNTAVEKEQSCLKSGSSVEWNTHHRKLLGRTSPAAPPLSVHWCLLCSHCHSCTDGHEKGFSQQGLWLGWMWGGWYFLKLLKNKRQLGARLKPFSPIDHIIINVNRTLLFYSSALSVLNA